MQRLSALDYSAELLILRVGVKLSYKLVAGQAYFRLGLPYFFRI
jgi:hypothetical protein